MPASTQPQEICELSSLPGLHLSPYHWLCSFFTSVSRPVSTCSASHQSHHGRGLFHALPTDQTMLCKLPCVPCGLDSRLLLSPLPLLCLYGLHRFSSGPKHMDLQKGESCVPSLAMTLHCTDPSCPLLTSKFSKVGSSSY